MTTAPLSHTSLKSYISVDACVSVNAPSQVHQGYCQADWTQRHSSDWLHVDLDQGFYHTATRDAAGTWSQVELTIQRSSQLPEHNSGHVQTQSGPASHLQQQSPEQQQHQVQLFHQQQQRQEVQYEQGLANGNVPHRQPVATPFAQTAHEQREPLNGQLAAPDGQPAFPNGQLEQAANGHSELPGTGSQPILLQGQGQMPGPGRRQVPGPSQQPLPGTRAEGGSSTEEEDREDPPPGGLQKEAEEKLRGLSRLEEDALEAKVAGPIGQPSSESPISHLLTTALLISCSFLRATFESFPAPFSNYTMFCRLCSLAPTTLVPRPAKQTNQTLSLCSCLPTPSFLQADLPNFIKPVNAVSRPLFLFIKKHMNIYMKVERKNSLL